ncbi:hypothetical protein HJC23_011218 [Cyclotella cryptica]|uniref:Histone acetyltransferase n=1 Tax=Cyclotella cryptica TaxID=29204 RepID=A0ABD3PV98_9STRA|eukprot:CCRYP_011038-RA/>CCRYP_011038-RA protein AED:0.00 eAED:0.00 QI:428/-1/1/1/-1/1/1/325/819
MASRRGGRCHPLSAQPSHRNVIRSREEEDPDYELIHAFPSPNVHRPRRYYQAIIDKGQGLAFSSLNLPDSAEHETLYAGMSSAAACIVLELPHRPVVTPREHASLKVASKKLNKQSGQRNRAENSLSIEDMHVWQDSMGVDCHRFKPVFTHQFFVEERIKGYRPTERAEEEAMSVLPGGASLHKSFSYLSGARHELSIRVQLAPSCRKSCIILTVGKVKRQYAKIVSHTRHAKRALALSNEASQQEVACFESDDDYVPTCSSSRKRTKRNNCVLPQKRSRFKENQAAATNGIRRSRGRRVQIQLSSDESEEDDADGLSLCGQSFTPIATRRSLRRCVRIRHQSKRALFTISESEDSSSTQSFNDTSDWSSIDKPLNRPHNNHLSETPKLTRSMSSQSSDSVNSSTSTGGICLDGGRMRVETIVKHMMRGLPNVEAVLLFDGNGCSVSREDGSFKSLSSSIKSIDCIDGDYLEEPVGTVIREYTRNKCSMSLRCSGGIVTPSREINASRNTRFVLSLADMTTDASARQYHDEVEKLAPWWIETADSVHMCDTKGISKNGGYWRVLYLFEKHETPPPKRGRGRPPKSRRSRSNSPSFRYSLAGYMTFLYHDKKLVVCQVLLLPPYQRCGHGTELMKAAHTVARHGISGLQIEPVYQIDVVMPAPAFVALRDRVDYDLFSQLVTKCQTPLSLIPREYAQPIDLYSPSTPCLTPLPDLIISEVSSKLRIIPRQVEVAYEIWLLSKIDSYIKDEVATCTHTATLGKLVSSLETCYKIIVKRSLLRAMGGERHNEDFHSLTVDEQKENLEASFLRTFSHYRSIIR